MSDPTKLIEEAFERGGTVDPDDFGWLVRFLDDPDENPDGAIELLNFSLGFQGTYVEIFLLVRADLVGRVCQRFSDAQEFPAPFTIDIFSHASPNPDVIPMKIGWGGG